MSKNYEINSYYYCINSYHYPDDLPLWLTCPICGLKPKIWVFDNGRFTTCGCWNNRYDHRTIQAESINSVLSRTNSTLEYNFNELRENWNHWCKTGEILYSFIGNKKKDDIVLYEDLDTHRRTNHEYTKMYCLENHDEEMKRLGYDPYLEYELAICMSYTRFIPKKFINVLNLEMELIDGTIK